MVRIATMKKRDIMGKKERKEESEERTYIWISHSNIDKDNIQVETFKEKFDSFYQDLNCIYPLM